MKPNCCDFGARSRPMSFATELAAAAGTLTAAQIAAATGASKRTVENWRSGRNTPNAREWASLVASVKAARRRARFLPQT